MSCQRYTKLEFLAIAPDAAKALASYIVQHNYSDWKFSFAISMDNGDWIAFFVEKQPDGQENNHNLSVNIKRYSDGWGCSSAKEYSP